MPDHVLLYVTIDECGRSTVFVGLRTTGWPRRESAVGNYRDLEVDLEEVLLLVKSRRISAGALTSESERDGLEVNVRRDEHVEFQPFDAMLGKIDPGLSVPELHINDRAERHTPPSLMRSVSWRAFHLVTGVIDGKPPVDGTRHLDADHRMNAGAKRFKREGEARGGWLEGRVE